MPRVSRGLLGLLLVLPLAPGLGCGQSEGTPNPELKVPDIPPGRTGGGMETPDGAQKKGKKQP